MDDIIEQELLEGIIAWTQIRSHTFDVAGVNQIITKASDDCERIGMSVERFSELNFGDMLKARMPDGSGCTEGGILVLGHVDTVHCPESIGCDVPIVVEAERVYGPGIYDMKGGMRAALYGFKVASRRGRPHLPVTFMFIPDEEIGSPTTRELIEAEARKQKYVLVPEPTHGRKLVSGRHAFLRYTLTTRGSPAHAGVNNRDGKSAVRAMAELIQEVEGFSDYERGETYSVGVVHGGLFVNVVPTSCVAQVLAVAPTHESFLRIQRKMAALAGEGEGGVVVEVAPGPVRPLFEASEGTLFLFDQAAQIAAEIGINLQHAQFGGGSDGNFTGALGIPTLDGLGVDGAALHTAGEYMLRTTMVQRCHILSRLIATLQ
ncbi:M20/M25/M40 family metallo-hydrolase [Mesorhizobium sp. STM 4661]|uniref:M20/M25/M40 family metallo-hydrolase n=1 Tax=Mesorhizobium sp. STM 4661 TaxID=1297570 RepID=UPI0002C023CA|nr:M20/M25/M40 family metallo-hydrolase [Mesorhizobium sp. STM 4661]CCV11530.1 Carboxypeptidase [Mesorhizobium sp. STM 4661]